MKRLAFMLILFPLVLSAAVPTWQGLGTGLNGICRTIVKDSQGRLYAGGDFTLAGGISANSIAYWDGIKWHACTTGLNGICRCIIADELGNIYAGGDFTMAGGQSCLRIAKWDGITWTTVGAGFNNSVRCISISPEGSISAGGTFTKSGTATINRVAKWNGNSWQSLGSGLSGSCYAMSFTTSGIQYVGGSFTTAGGITVNNIAMWDGLSWHALGTGLSNTCRAIAINQEGKLYCGGDFVNAGGILVNRIASWNGTAWLALGAGANKGLTGGGLSCQSIIIDDMGTVFAGGGFLAAGGVPVLNLAQWKGGSWSALGNGIDNTVNTFFADPCKRLFVGSNSSTVAYIQGFNLGERLWGRISVGNGGDFQNLTGDSGLFKELSTKGLNGPVSAIIVSDLIESGQYALQAVESCGEGIFSIFIGTEGNVNRQVSGNCAGGLVRFENAAHVKLEGSSGYHLQITNNCTYSPAIIMSAVNDLSIRHCVLESRDISIKGGVISIISSNNGQSSNIKIDSNRFKDFPRNGIVVEKDNGSGWRILANDFYNALNETTTRSMTIIDFGPGSSSFDNQVGNNCIGGSLPALLGSAWNNAGSVTFKGISVNAGSCLVESNKISNITLSNPGTSDFIGIESIAGIVKIGSEGNGNTIGADTTKGAIKLAGFSNFFGIRSMSASPGIVIEGNRIGNVESTCLQAYPNLYGIFFRTGKVQGNIIHDLGTIYPDNFPSIFGILNLGNSRDTNIIANNMIVLNGDYARNTRIFGIQDNVISSTFSKYLHNTVVVTGKSTGIGRTYAFHRNYNGRIFLRNNIFVNLSNSGATLNYSISTGTSADYLDSDYNDLYSGQNCLGFINCTLCQALTDWQLHSGGEAHSISVQPQFLSASDLHLQPVINPLLINGGIALPEISKDIDGEDRDNIHPALGADEE